MLLDRIQNVFDSALSECSSPHQLVLCGDVNGLFKHTGMPSFLLCNNLSQLIDFPTREKNTLDIFATTHPNLFLQALSVAPLGKSDHSGFFLQSSRNSSSIPLYRKVMTRDFREKNHGLFLSLLLSINWDTILSSDSVDNAISSFNDVVFTLFDICFPLRSVRMREDDPPWMTPFIKFLFNRIDRTFSTSRSQYICLREEFSRNVSRAKATFCQSLFADVQNSRQKWKNINRISKRSPAPHSISNDQADQLNVNFSSSFLPSDIHELDAVLSCNSVDSSSTSFCVSEFDVFSELKRIRSSKCGYDMIPGWVFKRYAHELAAPLTAIFNRCFNARYFPDAWKLANINPIKKGHSAYRPISLLPCPSKILEKLFMKKIIVPLLQPSFNVFQFGFLPTRFGGCCNAVTYARLDILRHLSFHGGYVRWLQIDIKKAFDQASHSVILSSLQKHFNNCSPVLAFVRSFLSNRWQRVLSSSGECSSWSAVTSGVPQGSVLGPFLFAIMMNDFPSLSSNSKMIAYADDIVLLHHVRSNESDNLQADLNIVLNWISDLKFSVNVEKFRAVTFSRNAFSLPPLSSNGVVIPEVQSTKFLGILFQNDLKHSHHATSVLLKASRNMYAVKLLWLNKAPGKVIWEAYLSLVFSIFSYRWPAICDMQQSSYRKFCSIEKRACRWAGISFSEATLRTRLDNICVRLIRKIAKDHDNHPLAEFFQHRQPNPSLRHTRALQIPSKGKAFYRNSFLKYHTST